MVLLLLLLLLWRSCARNSASISSKSSAGRALFLALDFAGIVVEDVTLFDRNTRRFAWARMYVQNMYESREWRKIKILRSK
jgi:hypothetical protein